MTTVRWTFTDTETSETVTLPVNPNKMDTPTFARQVQWGYSYDGSLRAVDSGPDRPAAWSFSGVLLSKSHYDLLLAWAKRSAVLHITDHLERTFEVVVVKYDPIERRPTATKSWRANYTMACLLLKEDP